MTNPVLTVTARDIALASLRASGIIRPDEEPQAEDLATAIEAMNYLLKQWQAEGYHLWKQQEGILFTNVGQEKYLVGPEGAQATTEDDFIWSQLAVAAVATDTQITVDSTEGMLGAANILNTNPATSTQDWTAGNSATLTADITGLTVTNGAASAGFADYTLDYEPGEVYLVDYGYELGTSVSAEFSIIDPVTSAVLATNTESASTTGVLEFTATQSQLTFRVGNTSTTLGEDSKCTFIEQRLKNSGDFCGIKLDDNTRFWTKIVRVVSDAVLDLNDPVPGDAAIDQTVFTFSELIDRPLRIYNERTETITQDNEIPIRKWSREEYMRQPTKSSQGTIVKIYYSPQLSNGELYVWQTAGDVNQIARFTVDAPIEVNESGMDNPDIPSEWFNPLKWNVAAEILPEYRSSEIRIAQITAKAATSLAKALSFDEENDELSISPDYEGIKY